MDHKNIVIDGKQNGIGHKILYNIIENTDY